MHSKFEIKQASIQDASVLTELAIQTFLESHGHSASEQDIQDYIALKFTEEELKRELADPSNLFYMIYSNGKLVGYSKIIPNLPFASFQGTKHTKMERLYLLEETHGSGLGKTLFDFNLNLTKELEQDTLWLYTWVENNRAIHFYKKCGFQIVDSADFQISKTHSNPNHIMQLQLD